MDRREGGGDRLWPIAARILARVALLHYVRAKGRLKYAVILERQLARLYEEAREIVRPKLNRR